MTGKQVLCLLGITFGFAALAPAQPYNRTAVSINGNDLNSCSMLSPCRSFNRAISQTTSGGEVIAIDSGGYGPFTANKKVTIQAAPGVYAGITATTGTNAITVLAGLSDVVVIRGLSLYSQSSDHGIHLSLAQAVHVENCDINGFNFGIRVTNGQLFVSDSVFRGNSLAILLNFNAFGPSTRAWIDHTQLKHNGDGLKVFGADAIATIRDSVIAANTGDGLSAITNGDGWVTRLFVDDCKVAGNGTGIKGFISSGGSVPTIYVARSTITANMTGVLGVGLSQVISFGNNHLAANGTDGAFTSTQLPE